jgi:hypothetical protein
MVFHLVDTASGTSIANVTVAVKPPASPTTFTFTANPNPIIVPAGSTLGQTTLTWQASGAYGDPLAIRVGSPGGGTMAGSLSASGSAATGNWVGNGTALYLVDQVTGQTLSSLTVRVITQSPASIFQPSQSQKLTNPTVSLYWGGAGDGIAGYDLAAGTYAGGQDLWSETGIAPTVTSRQLYLSGNAMNGQTMYVTLTTRFAASGQTPATSVASTSTYTLQSLEDALVGTYSLGCCGNGEALFFSYCTASGQRSVTPAVISNFGTTVNIAPGASGGTFLFSVSGPAGSVASYPAGFSYTLSGTDYSNLSFVSGSLRAVTDYGFSPNPIAFPGLMITRHFDTGSIEISNLPSNVLTFEASEPPSPGYCAATYDLVMGGISYIKRLW